MHKYKLVTINRHLRKMFTALSSIIVNDDDNNKNKNIDNSNGK